MCIRDSYRALKFNAILLAEVFDDLICAETLMATSTRAGAFILATLRVPLLPTLTTAVGRWCAPLTA